ncbi:Aldo/keto reductase [Exidia glandulosa HHB12029]|uniref:Aldo/keto reductase n=1 Tax=Exidia glandulosa HHB12029 TaxID=1314781 RepID=A0A165H739_EXIGL|nr:Aldo/keto reductase [Exidia glandulosa HHB12029]
MPFPLIKLNDGNEIPGIAYGTGSARFGKDATVFVKQAISTGFTHIDTAQAYQNEDSVGLALSQAGVARKDLYVTTKYRSGDIKAALQSSLKKLGLKYVDLYLIHTPTAVKDIPAAWKVLESFVDAGLVKSIGVSNFEVEHLEQVLRVARIKPVANQIRLHPYNWHLNEKLIGLCIKEGIVLEAYGSLFPITSAPGGPVDRPLQNAAARIGGTPAQVIFSWLKSKGVVVVTTSSTESRLKEYLGTADLPPLTNDEVTAIETAGASGQPLK